MGSKIVGGLMMVGSLVFAFLYDTGRWPAVWSVIEHGSLPANFGQTSSNAIDPATNGYLPGTSTVMPGTGGLPGVSPLPGGGVLPDVPYAP
jgi:hypothetical protein